MSNASQNTPKKKGFSARNLLEIALGILCVRIFGALETLLGIGVWALVSKLGKKNHPDAKWPDVVGIVAGLVVAFVAAVLVGMLLAG